MPIQQLMTGNVMWCYDHELEQANTADEFRVMLSFAQPLHYHAGQIVLTDTALLISGDIDLHIPLDAMEQLYMGFDDHYKRMYVKNGGLFWQPLRVTYANGSTTSTVYLIIDHDWMGARNKIWYEALTSMFA
ncbi:hypothetical protein LLH06_02510 [Mucilaginibacter daejeonensis]|uniref:hypothetical protein n=1 Tax=Mucilaginibacter daejeonensis TaxID=398049 RepID=UPI001D17202B|nr:hypothetical protein [Mucilaginibacter daejeonensis]UEG53845.1 hypothetical protein LLH06_02510 [Mucilaginibacter daejeonensis]